MMAREKAELIAKDIKKECCLRKCGWKNRHMNISGFGQSNGRGI